MALRYELLDATHDRTAFTCGVSALDDWFHTRAGQDQRRRVAQVFVAVDDVGIAGFYSLGIFTVGLDELPTALARKLPRYDAIPAALIGRLARHTRLRGTHVGERLVADAIVRVLRATESVAAYAIIVDAKDDRARAFYRGLGFLPLPSRPDRLFLPTATAAAAHATAQE